MATFGVKTLLNWSRDHSVGDSLRYGLTWNAAMIQGGDMGVAGAAFIGKTTPRFPNLDGGDPDDDEGVARSIAASKL